MKRLFVILGLLGINLFLAPEVSSQNFIDDETNTTVDALHNGYPIGDKQPIPLPTIRENDVMWKKTIWREIDFRQKMNQGFYYPETPHQDWKNLFTILKDALSDPSTGVVAYKDEHTGELLNPITWSEIQKNIKQTETVHVYDDDGNITGEKTVESEMSSSDVMRCQIKEVWYFDKQRSQLLVKLMAICPVRMVPQSDGSMLPERLFWVPYDDNLRKVLVNTPFYNRNNAAMQLSYDDVFVKRVFDSYIIREDNMYDRNVNTYATGVDALNESERIKQSIIDYEQFLWEY